MVNILDGLITFELSSSIASVNRFDRERKVMVTSNISKIPLDSLVKHVDQGGSDILPEGHNYRLTEDVERMQNT